MVISKGILPKVARHNRVPANGCLLHNDCLSCPFPDCIKGTKQYQTEIKGLDNPPKDKMLRSPAVKKEMNGKSD